MKPFNLFFITLLITTTAQAQSIPDDLRGLINQANTNYPRLKEQQQLLRAGEVRVDIARAAYQPNITGNGTYQYVTPVAKATLPVNGNDQTIQFQPNHNMNANIGVGQTIYDFGRTDASIRQAADQVQLLSRNIELTRQTLGYQVAAAYYGIGFLQKSIVVQDSVIKVAQGNIQIFANRLQNGEALQYDLLTQQVRLKTAQNRKIDLQNNLERQRALLTYLTGDPNPAISPAAAQFEAQVQPFTLEGSLQTAQTNNKEVQLAQDRVRVAQTDVLANERSGRPNLSFNGSAGFKNGYLPDIAAMRFNVAAGVSLSVPIYSGKRYSLQNQAARLNLDASRYAVENANAQLRQNLEQLNADIRSNQQRLQNLETQVLQARKALEIAQIRLRSGVITPVELQSAETGIEEAELARLNYQYQLLLNQLEYKRLLGENL
ncbi:TolC family protein [Larkinella rosea]|uniref:TolC family protein n=1 Tax=Larkinella rosea TaxID=2025312 RepID=A0A3P1BSL9_9BACT|nr:TolC family protein [Larkinella rosea]RRB04115.1 TolC family protein [Larkinella rosea]